MNNEQTMSNEEAIKILEVDKAYLYPDDCYNTGAYDMAIEALRNDKTNAIKRDVWELYQRHQTHLGTYVYEFGVELKELLGRYEGGRQ